MNDWLTVKQMTEEFGFSRSTQDKMRREKVVPYIKVGKIVKYHRPTMVEWIESQITGDDKLKEQWKKDFKGE